MLTSMIAALVFLTTAAEHRGPVPPMDMAAEVCPHKPPAPPGRAHPQLRARELSPCGMVAAARRAGMPVGRRPRPVWQTGWPGICRGAVTDE